MHKSRHAEIDDKGSGKATRSPMFNPLRVAEIAKDVGDPQCYRGKAAGPPWFRVGDRLRVKERPDLFYNQTPGYLRGAVGPGAEIAHESPAPEDEAWGISTRANGSTCCAFDRRSFGRTTVQRSTRTTPCGPKCPNGARARIARAAGARHAG
jgi:hypothetical protein